MRIRVLKKQSQFQAGGTRPRGRGTGDSEIADCGLRIGYGAAAEPPGRPGPNCTNKPNWPPAGLCRVKQSQLPHSADREIGVPGEGRACETKPISGGQDTHHSGSPSRCQLYETKPIRWEGGSRAGRPTLGQVEGRLYEEAPVRNKAKRW